MASLVLDQYLRCAVCMDFFSDPYRLPCSHTFCKRCIEGVRKSCLSFNCPECRQMIRLDYRGVEGLERERRLSAMVDEFAHQLHRSRVCNEHMRTVEGFCETCAVLMCGRCFFSKQHNGHSVGDVESTANRKRDEIMSELTSTKDKISTVLQEHDTSIRNRYSTVQKQIVDEFEKLRDQIQDKEKELLRDVESRMTSAINGNVIIRTMTEHKQQLIKLEESIPSDDVLLLQSFAEVKERLTSEIKKTSRTDSHVADLSNSVLTFSHPNIDEFLQAIKLTEAASPRPQKVIQEVREETSESDKTQNDTQKAEPCKPSTVMEQPSLTLLHRLSPKFAVHAATFLTSGLLVLLDLKSTLLLFSYTGESLCTLTLEDKPFDISAISEHTLAVSMGAAKVINLVDVKDNKFTITGKIALDTECFHVSSIDDKVVTGNGSLLSFFSISGQRLKTIIMPGMIQALCISKSHKKLYLNIRSEYIMRTDVRGNREYKYQSDNLQDVGGIAIDNRCHAFICGCKSNNVHQINSEGRLVRVILSQVDGIIRPFLIGFDASCTKLFLIEKDGDFRNGTLKHYRIT